MSSPTAVSCRSLVATTVLSLTATGAPCAVPVLTPALDIPGARALIASGQGAILQYDNPGVGVGVIAGRCAPEGQRTVSAGAIGIEDLQVGAVSIGPSTAPGNGKTAVSQRGHIRCSPVIGGQIGN